MTTMALKKKIRVSKNQEFLLTEKVLMYIQNFYDLIYSNDLQNNFKILKKQ